MKLTSILYRVNTKFTENSHNANYLILYKTMILPAPSLLFKQNFYQRAYIFVGAS